MTPLQKKIAEAIIAYMKSHGGEGNFYSLRTTDIHFSLPEGEDWMDNKNAVRIGLIHEGYIRQKYNSPSIPLDMVLTLKGHDFISFDDERQKHERNERRQLYESENARIAFEDYPMIKKRARSAEISAWIAAAAALGSMIIALIALKR